MRFYLFLMIMVAGIYMMTPMVLGWLTGKNFRRGWLLALACVLFAVSWFIPSPLIVGRDTAFMTHLVGGGIFAGVLWVYIKQTLGWRAVWWVELASLFAFVSALGVAVELLELLLVNIGVLSLSLDDTSWDLLANTCGAVVVYAVYGFNKIIKRVNT